MEKLKIIKKAAKTELWFAAILATLCMLNGNVAFAQTEMPEKINVDINTGVGPGADAGWYTQPWVWIVGVAIFIIIIIALTRSPRRGY